MWTRRYVVLVGMTLSVCAATPAFAGAATRNVEISSRGVVELTPDELTPMQVFHVRIAVTNPDDERSWTLDVRDATIVTMRGHRSHALFVNADGAGLPVLGIPRHERRIVDLYFPVNHDRVVALRWRVITPAGPVDGSWRVQRASNDGLPRTARHWWADPDHPWPLFHRSPGPIMHRAPTHAMVSRSRRNT